MVISAIEIKQGRREWIPTVCGKPFLFKQGIQGSNGILFGENLKAVRRKEMQRSVGRLVWELEMQKQRRKNWDV